MSQIVTRKHTVVQDPPIAQWLFSDTRLAWVWVIVRVYIGWSWLTSGWGKFTNPAWLNTGEALKSYWVNALKLEPRPVIYFDWYRSFIQFLVDTQAYTWFAKLVLFGELAVGIALILGAFTGIAAFFGGFLNWNFLMAGTASSNPVMFVLQMLIVLGWKVAGYYGADRILLPWLGTPWPDKPIEDKLAPPKQAPLRA
jgi:thiosulfate dehydrogenase [quinone] large subunit